MAKRVVHEMVISPAKHPPGSYTTETRFKKARGGQGGGPAYEYETEHGAHESLDGLHDHIDKMLGASVEAKDEGATASEKLNKKDRGGAEEKEED